MQVLIAEFLRDELRSLLKANRVSYHKVGPQNLMKSKAEMAADLMGLIRSGELSATPAAPVADEDDEHARPKKKRVRSAVQKQQNSGVHQQLQLQLQHHQHQQQVLSSRLESWIWEPPPALTPRTRAAAEIILTFPPTSPRARQKILDSVAKADQEATTFAAVHSGGSGLGRGPWAHNCRHSSAAA